MQFHMLKCLTSLLGGVLCKKPAFIKSLDTLGSNCINNKNAQKIFMAVQIYHKK